MLILSRRQGETIVINRNIMVTVAAIDGNQVKLRIDAPREIPVHRKEVQDAIDRKNDQCTNRNATGKVASSSEAYRGTYFTE